jgi:hypothetical protein
MQLAHSFGSKLDNRHLRGVHSLLQLGQFSLLCPLASPSSSSWHFSCFSNSQSGVCPVDAGSVSIWTGSWQAYML